MEVGDQRKDRSEKKSDSHIDKKNTDKAMAESDRQASENHFGTVSTICMYCVVGIGYYMQCFSSYQF